ncbi:MAG: nitrous oxide reductase accessory protein NosL [Flavobacteriales bacterium]|nr:nitrous oxide reductase accessory protein NosL [Flavobacteriales bacterium]
MKNPLIIIALLASTLVFSCNVEPEPINYGKDACDHCRMTIMDPKFGAELVTAKGKVYKFDDVNCMVNHAKGLAEGLSGAAHILVTDMQQPATLIAVGSAFFLRSDEVRSPMGSRVAAFSEQSVRDSRLEMWGGTALDWNETKNIFE